MIPGTQVLFSFENNKWEVYTKTSKAEISKWGTNNSLLDNIVLFLGNEYNVLLGKLK